VIRWVVLGLLSFSNLVLGRKRSRGLWSYSPTVDSTCAYTGPNFSLILLISLSTFLFLVNKRFVHTSPNSPPTRLSPNRPSIYHETILPFNHHPLILLRFPRQTSFLLVHLQLILINLPLILLTRITPNIHSIRRPHSTPFFYH
jgi:hypothetical protein